MSYVVMVTGLFVLAFIGLPGLQSPNPEERESSKVVTTLSFIVFSIGILLWYLGQ